MSPPPTSQRPESPGGLRIALLAGEASGDRLGAGLATELRQRYPHVQLAGLAGAQMQNAGVTAWWDASELAVMGLVEVLTHLPRLLRLRHQLLQRLLDWQPDLVVCIDAPDFHLPLAAKLKQQQTPVIQYVCPSVWAWRPGRVNTLRKAVDHVLCLLPFEQQFLHQHAVPASFVGHPLAQSLRAPDAAEKHQLRQQLSIPADQLVIAMLPGSRNSELQRLVPVFLDACLQLQQQHDRPLLLLTALTSQPHLQQLQTLHAMHAPQLNLQIAADSQQALRAADAALLASGTVSLEAMLCGCPMVVAYRLQPLTWALLRYLKLYKARHFALPNLLANTLLVPELVQHQVTPIRLAQALQKMLIQDQQQLRRQFEKLTQPLRLDSDALAVDVIERLLPCN